MLVYISLVVNTLNEERNIADCILSAKDLVNEVVVADMHSDDRTVEIAQSLGASVYQIERRPFVDPVRNFAIDKANGDWILLLDADERLVPELVTELRRVAEADQADVVELHFDTFMFGQQIQYFSSHEGRCRFFRKGFLRYTDQEVHGLPKTKGRHLVIPPSAGRLQHYNYENLRHFIKKMNDYTDGEALKLLRSDGTINPLRGAYWGFRNFFKRYFRLECYKGGNYGFILSVLMGFYWFLSFCKAWELKKQNLKKIPPK
jgi:glycosyltransferase involved in cell wall biosynthesis